MDVVLPEVGDKALTFGWFVFSTLIVAGFSLSTGVSHLFDWWYQRHEKDSLAFSVICLAVAGHAIALVFLNRVSTVADYVLALKIDLCLLFIAQPAFVWFVTSHMRVRARPFTVLFSAYFTVLTIINLLSANSLMVDEVVNLFVWFSPGGEPHVSAVYEPSVWSPLCLAGTLATYIYCIVVIIRGRHNVERGEAIVLAISLVCMFTTWLQTLLVNPPVVGVLLISHYTFLAFMFLMGSALASRYGRQALALAVTHRALQESEEQFRLLFEKAPDAIVVYDLEQDCFVDANKNATVLFGCSREELLGSRIRRFLPSPTPSVHAPAETFRTLGSRAMEGEEQAFEQTIRNLAGSELVCEVRLARLPSSDRPFIRASFMDISERKQAEKKQLEYQQRLRSLASELALTEERERKRIAMYLHDEIAQDLVTAQMKLGDVALDIADVDVSKRIDRVREILDNAIKDTYSLTFDLSLPILYELGLVPAIEWLGEKITENHGILFRLIDDGLPKPLSNDIRGVCFDVMRELLRNVVKHAKATEIVVTARVEDAQLCLVIEDNGQGFDSSAPADVKRSDGGFGMFFVRERLEYLRGSIRVESEGGKGTRITLTAPLSDAHLQTGSDGNEDQNLAG
ncbi:MAG: PAS domain S-box protein [Candidatus Hydrogenedentes bacterium]|nr:PAS domain S-box protein [Candidatus Hydrogenedentota bacterium]